ncbi:MAG: glycosyltransferase [Gemmatimonadaceae bacterium]|jgi:hypothetical protein
MTEGLFRRFVDLARTARRTTIVGPLMDAWLLRAVLDSIDGDPRDVRVMGPDEFAPYLRCLMPLRGVADDLPVRAFPWVIVPQAALAGLPPALLRGLRDDYLRVMENRRYLLFRTSRRDSAIEANPGMRARLDALLAPTDAGNDLPALKVPAWKDRAILVTTFERPAALERSLPQLVRLGAPVLVVDDGSRTAAAHRNQGVTRAHGAEYLRLPSNRGISAALNAGLAYLLADSHMQWISCVQDDADVRADLLESLHRLEDAALRPLLTGYDAAEHAVLEEREISGLRVLLKRETAGVHLHAHRDYWRGVLPIPTEYLGAPKRRWEASLEDSWITTGAPASAARRGIPVVCVPGLVRTFLWHPGDSTWGNPNEPDARPEPETGSA